MCEGCKCLSLFGWVTGVSFSKRSLNIPKLVTVHLLTAKNAWTIFFPVPFPGKNFFIYYKANNDYRIGGNQT